MIVYFIPPDDSEMLATLDNHDWNKQNILLFIITAQWNCGSPIQCRKELLFRDYVQGILVIFHHSTLGSEMRKNY